MPDKQPGTHRPKGECPVCHGYYVVTDGVLNRHGRNRSYDAGLVGQCDGTGQPPVNQAVVAEQESRSRHPSRRQAPTHVIAGVLAPDAVSVPDNLPLTDEQGRRVGTVEEVKQLPDGSLELTATVDGDSPAGRALYAGISPRHGDLRLTYRIPSPVLGPYVQMGPAEVVAAQDPGQFRREREGNWTPEERP